MEITTTFVVYMLRLQVCVLVAERVGSFQTAGIKKKEINKVSFVVQKKMRYFHC